MSLRVVGAVLSAFLLGVSSAAASPHAQPAGSTIELPFDPPVGENLTYRMESTDTRNGKTRMSWSVDRYKFEKADSGYRLTVEPVSGGSNETDPRMKEALRRLEDLTKRPFVLHLDEDAQIVGLEGANEYWTKIIQVLRDVLSSGKPTPQTAKVIETAVGMFEGMPAEARLAKLTQPIQPLLEFANTRTTEAQPIRQQIETASPFGGTIQQDVVITLTDVSDGLAHLAVRTSIPRSELEKATGALFEKFRSGALKPEEVAKAKAALPALKDFKSETVADYYISIEDGMLKSFQSTQTISVNEGEKTEVQVKTLSMRRVD